MLSVRWGSADRVSMVEHSGPLMGLLLLGVAAWDKFVAAFWSWEGLRCGGVGWGGVDDWHEIVRSVDCS